MPSHELWRTDAWPATSQISNSAAARTGLETRRFQTLKIVPRALSGCDPCEAFPSCLQSREFHRFRIISKFSNSIAE